jgi:hypothetical protein
VVNAEAALVGDLGDHTDPAAAPWSIGRDLCHAVTSRRNHQEKPPDYV